MVDTRLAGAADDDDVRVLVEPLYGCVAVISALDAGWDEVEFARLDGGAPIPLVSFEQPPPDGATRCRVRCDDLAGAAIEGALLAAPVNARPACVAISARATARVTFLAVPSSDALAADSWWAAGMLVRVLLEEVGDERVVRLTDAAGLAVMIAQGAEDASVQLSAAARWRTHLAAGGHADDLRVASAIDTIGVVPVVRREGDRLVATAV